ncbi:MAG: gliding motility-associated C-terminal domain-containing protein, partial [Bacteroidales bacterium]
DILKWESSEDGFSTTTSLPSNDSVLSVSNLTHTTQYRVIVQGGSCQPDTSNSITITVYPQSTAHLSGDTTICDGSTATLKVDFTGVSPWSLEYENNIDTILITGIVDNPYNFSANPSLTTTYSIVAMVDGNGCSGITSGSANLEPVSIAANPGEDSSLCGLTFQFNAVPGIGTGIWTQTSGPGTSFFTPGAEFPDAEVTVDAYGAYKFTWTETLGICVDDSTITIDFFDSPLTDAGSGSTVCGLTAGLQANPSVGIGTWSVLTGPGTAVFTPDKNDPNALVKVNTEGSYEIMWTETNGPCIDSDTITLTFFNQPVADAGNGGEECDLDFQLQAIPSAGTGEWTKTSGRGSATFSPATNDPDALITVDQYGSYRFTWTETNGPCIDSATIAIVFNEHPNANVIVGGDNCGLSFMLEAIPSVGIGEWSIISGPGTADFVSGVNSTVTTVSVDEYGSYGFIWKETNGNCSDDITAYVNFFDKIIVDAGTDEEVCSQEYVLNATPGKGSGYWSKVSGPGKVSFSPSDTASNVTVSVDEFGTYEFQWFEAIGDCNGSDNVEIRFHVQPTADAGPDQVLEYVFSTYLEAGIHEFGTGNWELVKGTGQVQDENDPGSQVTGLSLGENEFTWTIKTGVCEDVSDNVVILVNDLLTPTVITPNNDGYNDYLVFSGTDELNDNEIIIYSRWGTEVYRSKDYQNDWDGRDHNNRELPLDTYYYILKLSSGRLIKGFVEIRR